MPAKLNPDELSNALSRIDPVIYGAEEMRPTDYFSNELSKISYDRRKIEQDYMNEQINTALQQYHEDVKHAVRNSIIYENNPTFTEIMNQAMNSDDPMIKDLIEKLKMATILVHGEEFE